METLEAQWPEIKGRLKSMVEEMDRALLARYGCTLKG